MNWNGQLYDQCFSRDSSCFSDWVDGMGMFTCSRKSRMPVGYGGVVIGPYNWQSDWEDGQYIYDVADAVTLFFRLMPID